MINAPQNKSKNWIPDISKIFDTSFSSWTFIPQYVKNNPEMKEEDLNDILDYVCQNGDITRETMAEEPFSTFSWQPFLYS